MIASELKEILAEVPEDAVVAICNTVYDANPAELGGVFLMSNSGGDAMLGLLSRQGECAPSVKMPQGYVKVKLFKSKTAGSDGERWHLSEDGETYDYDAYGSMEEAIEAGKQKFGKDFYAGREIPWWPSVDEDVILSDLAYQAGEFAGESAEDWPDVSKAEREELREKLQDVLDVWLLETRNEPNFFMVEDSVHVVGGTAYRGWV